MNKSYGSVPLKTVKKAIKQIEDNYKVYNVTQEEIDETPITFEYLIGSFFPEVVKNVQAEANRQYTKGFIDGQNSVKEK